uniref:Uncharacterized protein n=1 Tax=Arundo donax TaxID=35708 RepID=A0A0A8ZQ44_ARUDO
MAKLDHHPTMRILFYLYTVQVGQHNEVLEEVRLIFMVGKKT